MKYIWIYNPLTNIHRRIQEKDYSEFIYDGYTRGRNHPKISEGKKGKTPNFSDEVRKKASARLSYYNQTRILTEKIRKKMSSSKKGTVACLDSKGNVLRVSKEEFHSRVDLVGIAKKT